MLLPHFYEGLTEAGCDEAGRGCLAGPVYAAAVILPDDYQNDLLNDSKQLSEKKRYLLREQIERDAIAWAVGIVDNEEIDRINILRASILAMHRALDALQVRPQAIIVDGNRFSAYKDSPPALPEGREPRSGRAGGEVHPQTSRGEEPRSGRAVGEVLPQTSRGEVLPHTTIVKGDGKYMAIAAASILAKTYRDDEMLRLHEQYPMYRWDSNKGYPSKAHREAIRMHGACPLHRRTFNLLGNYGQLELEF